jgi:hypothetical protein
MESKWSNILTPSTSIFSTSFEDLKWIATEFDHELFTKRVQTPNESANDNDVKPCKVDPFIGVGDVFSGNIAGAADFRNLVSALSLSHTMHFGNYSEKHVSTFIPLTWFFLINQSLLSLFKTLPHYIIIIIIIFYFF